MTLRAPFPWFGGKSRASSLIWDRFGDVPNYVEPFAGSLAVLLSRPHAPGIETVNDRDCFVANFWRAVQHDPDGVAVYADWPVNEADQHARHLWLIQQTAWVERMKTNPDYFDAKIAGWWVWGQCIWIGSGWCAGLQQLPHLGNAGKGVHRQLPHLGNAGKGVHRQLPHLGNAGTGATESARTSATRTYMRELAERLRSVRVCCGDWSRVCGPTPTVKLGITGVLLDPPYAVGANRTDDLYAVDDTDVAHEVRTWALANGDNPDLRIALCGYDGEHEMPETWTRVDWKARGGYGSQGDGRGRENAAKERIWFSPHCLDTGSRLPFYEPSGRSAWEESEPA
jgi:D12 class N6 adenine-specific DNA methyltransferase